MTKLALVKTPPAQPTKVEQEDHPGDEDTSTRSVYTLQNAELSIKR